MPHGGEKSYGDCGLCSHQARDSFCTQSDSSRAVESNRGTVCAFAGGTVLEECILDHYGREAVALVGARTLLGAPGLSTSSKKLLGAPGIRY